MPAVTVLMTTYNRGHLLPRALDGLVQQTFTDFDVVIVNDAGADPTPVVDRYADLLDIQLITHPTNLGVTKALNTSIAAATGRYVTLLADDDRYLPDHLATLHAAATANPLVIPYTDGVQVLEDADGNVLGREILPVPVVFDRDRLLVENYIPAMAQIVPLAAFDEVGGPFDPELEVLEDWDMWLRLSAVFEFRHVAEVTFEYYIRGGRSNITTREAWRFHRCLGEVYARHPVEPASRLASLRERALKASRRRADARIFDLTVVVAESDPDRLLGAMREIVGALDGRHFELVVVASRTPEIESLAAQVTGDVSFVLTSGDPRSDLVAVAGRKAAGRRIHIIEDTTDLRLEELTQPVAS